MRNLPTKRVLMTGKVPMIQARSIASQTAVVDVAPVRTSDSPAVQSAAVARLPDGYDGTDLRVLEWIVASRRPARASTSEAA